MYDGLNVVQELSGTTPIANLLTSLGLDEILLRTDAAGLRSFLTDALGSTLALADGTGTLVTNYTYDPFGKTTVAGIASTNAFKYTGREDDGTGLYYYRARYYHPQLQRFIAQDPIEFEGGDVNLYAYVENAPINFDDPLGLRISAPLPPGVSPEEAAGALEDDLLGLCPTPLGIVGKVAGAPLSAVKKALQKVYQKLGGKLPKGKPGKFGSPQAGDPRKGYRLDPPHDRTPGHPESKPHFNYWDYSGGKRSGGGGIKGVEPIE